MNNKARNATLTIFIAMFSVCTSQIFGQASRSPSVKPPAPAISKQQRETVENIVREYLLKNPAVIREAMQALQRQEEKQKSQATAENMKRLRSEIYADADSPAAGNAKGDVSIVVFFDYFCGYCKKTLPAVQTLLANDSSVRVVYKEFPILGPQSLIAAKAALAAARQGKFTEFHQAMLTADGAGDDVLKAVSEHLGMDYAKLQADMLDPKIAEAIDRNIHLAESINVSGTPAYLIGDQFIPGAIDSAALTRVVKDERAKLAKLDTEKVAAAKGIN